jgi:hypothetical protein
VGSGQRPARQLLCWPDLAVYGACLILAGIVVAPLWWRVGDAALAANATDHQIGLWFLAHAASVVQGGSAPLFASHLNVPYGVNMMANTSMLGLGLPVAPVTIVFGPRASFALLLTLSLAGTAAAWYWVFRRWLVDSPVAAAVGGLFSGFAPGMISHAGGQLNIVAQFVLPFIVVAVLRLGQPGHALRRILVLAGLITLQFFLNEELLLVTAIAIFVVLVCYAAAHRREAWALAPRFVGRLAIVAVLCGLLLAYPIWFQFFGPQHYRGLFQPASGSSTDLWAYGSYSSVSIGGAGRASDRFSASATELNTYLGYPLLALSAVLGWWLWDQFWARAAVVVALLFFLLSLGPSVVAGGRDTGIAGPFVVLRALPFGDLFVAGRLALVGLPAVGLLLALGLARVLRRGRDARFAVWIGAYAVALVPLLPVPLATQALPPPPAFVAGGEWESYVAGGRTVVPVPVPIHRAEGMVGQTWSAETLNRMPVPAGYFLGPRSASDRSGVWGPEPRPTALLLWAVEERGDVPAITDADRRRAVDDLRVWRAGVVVLADHMYANELRTVLDALLGPGRRVGGVWIWDVRSMTG